MTTVASVLQALEQIAPSRFAFSFDKIGLQVGDPLAAVTSAVVSLDRSLAAIDYCTEVKAELLVAHHPLIFDPLEAVTSDSHVGLAALAMAHERINFIAAHTNWDSAQGGVNDVLASLLGLREVRDFGSAAGVDQLKLVVFLPVSHLDQVLDAASAAGAGQVGSYRRCGFYSEGKGMFEPSAGASPFSSSGDPEVRLEMLLLAERRPQVERAIRQVHPYEELAIDFLSLTPKYEQPAGRIGLIDRTKLSDFVAMINRQLETHCWTWGDSETVIETVAVVGGAADGEWKNAMKAGADVFVTGEVKQHVALEAAESGMAIVAAGHYATEHPGAAELRNRLAEAIPAVKWHLFTPEPGVSGRPF
ncbi:MAG: Nif3-like dinuclear metal center hexameric protein [Fimbriimonadaceae bacterium]